MIDALELLKFDLHILHNQSDEYLRTRIDAAKKEIVREGIELNMEKEDHVLIIVDYAAWLYRKRTQDITFPRHLRYRMNNILISQKAGK